MEYTCKVNKKDKPVSFFLTDLAIRMAWAGGEEVIHYSGVKAVCISKSSGYYSVSIITIDNARYTITNRYVHDDGRVEDKSQAYAMFVRVLHMHLSEKSKADFTCITPQQFSVWLKYSWVPFAFAIAYAADFLGLRLFHPALHGVALALIGWVLISLAERNRVIEQTGTGEIPLEFLPG